MAGREEQREGLKGVEGKYEYAWNTRARHSHLLVLLRSTRLSGVER
jgi:hypothetical protein